MNNTKLKVAWLQGLLMILCIGIINAANINLLPNGDFEQLNTDPVTIELEDVLPDYARRLDGASGGKACILPGEMNQWQYVEFRLPKPLKPGEYIIQVRTFGDSSQAAASSLYDEAGGNHTLLFSLPIFGDQKFHTSRKLVKTDKEIKTLVLKKMANTATGTNPLDWIKISEFIIGEPFPKNWQKLGGESAATWSVDNFHTRSGVTAITLTDLSVDDTGIISDYFPVANQKYELSGWYTIGGAHDPKVKLGIAWYKSEGELLLEEYTLADVIMNNSWQQISTMVEPPVDAALARVFIKASSLDKGKLWLDDLALLGDPGILPKGEAVPFRVRGFAEGQIEYQPETGLIGRNRTGLYPTIYISKPVAGVISFYDSWEGDGIPFDGDKQRHINLKNKNLTITLYNPVPGLPISTMEFGSLDIQYSPYIAMLGYSGVGGWVIPQGISLEGKYWGWKNKSFASWNTNETTAASKLQGELLGVGLDLTTIAIWERRAELDGRGPLKEQALSVEADYQLLNTIDLNCVLNVLDKQNEELPGSWSVNLKKKNLIEGLNVDFSRWYCNQDFKPRYHDKTSRGYDWDLQYFSEGNWVDNNRGKQGYSLDANYSHGPLSLRSLTETYELMNQENHPLRERMLAQGTIWAGKNKITLKWEQRLEEVKFLEGAQKSVLWQATSAGVERPLVGILGSPLTLNYLYEAGTIQAQPYASQEITLKKYIKGLNLYAGYRVENEADKKQHFFKCGGNYSTPGGIWVSLVYTNPNLPHQGYYDSIREKYVENDNGFWVILSKWF